jgi:hypothetical protein
MCTWEPRISSSPKCGIWTWPKGGGKKGRCPCPVSYSVYTVVAGPKKLSIPDMATSNRRPSGWCPDSCSCRTTGQSAIPVCSACVFSRMAGSGITGWDKLLCRKSAFLQSGYEENHLLEKLIVWLPDSWENIGRGFLIYFLPYHFHIAKLYASLLSGQRGELLPFGWRPTAGTTRTPSIHLISSCEWTRMQSSIFTVIKSFVADAML